MKNRLWRIIIGAIFFIVAIVIDTNIEWLNIALYLISYIIVGGDIVKRAVRNIFKGKVEYSGAAEPQFRRVESHPSGTTEPPFRS